MTFAPALLLCLLLQPAPQAPARNYAPLFKRLDDWRKAKVWAAIANFCEAMPLPQREDFLFPWLEALERGKCWAKLLQVCKDPAHLDKAGASRIPSHFQGRALAELGRNADALAWGLSCARKGETMAYYEAWNSALALGNWGAALECAQGLVDKYPANGTFLGMRGEALTELKRYEGAEPSLVKAVQLAPKRATSWADLSCCYNQGARYQEAFDAASQAIALDPKLMVGWYNRGQACMGLKRYKEGRDDYAAALALGPPDPAMVASLKTNIEMADKYLGYVNKKRPGKP